ncbi:MAG: hypothetical protein P4L41_10685 [Flavipsychrobacter sp.]|nr:hypothetical protein [Flavipsychrobacter sp.]
MAKLLCSIKSGPHLSNDTTYFNKPVNLQYVQSIGIGEEDIDDVRKYYIEFEGIDVRWLFNSLTEMESVYEHIINHEF